MNIAENLASPGDRPKTDESRLNDESQTVPAGIISQVSHIMIPLDTGGGKGFFRLLHLVDR